MTREEAIKIIEVAKAEVEWEAPLDYQIAFDLAIEALRQPAQQWIPVMEKLPEDGEYVLVCADKIKSAFGPEDCRFLWRWVSGYSEKRVTAWMPLPEPYKGEV